MATEQELSASAAAHAKKTTKSWEWFLAEIRRNPAYNYKSTEWFKAGADLELIARPVSTPPPTNPPPPSAALDDARRRMFLANSPLDCLQAPPYMIPVCTADLGYRNYYTPDVIKKLRERFGKVEAWCDCRASGGTAYSVAQQMVTDLRLDGPAWGQCETAPEFDHGYAGGARRMVGQLAGLTGSQRDKIKSAEVHLAFELYRNVMPWQVPDYQGCQDGVGSNCIACYASATEGAVYTPVSDYIAKGYFKPNFDSVYGVGLLPYDWAAL